MDKLTLDPLQYTNNVDLWQKLGLDKTGDMLWLLYHQGRHHIENLTKLEGWSKANKIFLMDHEAFQENIDYLDRDPRIYLWDSTLVDHPRFKINLWWFNYVREIEKHMNLISKLLPAEIKKPTRKFDALLGTLRPHKSYILNLIKSYHKPDDFLLGHCGSLFQLGIPMPDGWIPGGSFEPVQHQHVPYFEQCVAQSCCFIPYEIYNQTWYSLVCETNGSGPVLYTEKLAKCFLAGRVFVLVGARHSLKHLRNLGFKTFSYVIDESYDDIENDQLRWQAAWNATTELSKLDPVEVYHSCQIQLEHNQNLIRNIDWTKTFETEVLDILTKSL